LGLRRYVGQVGNLRPIVNRPAGSKRNLEGSQPGLERGGWHPPPPILNI
jgi:hypothetical protein